MRPFTSAAARLAVLFIRCIPFLLPYLKRAVATVATSLGTVAGGIIEEAFAEPVRAERHIRPRAKCWPMFRKDGRHDAGMGSISVGRSLSSLELQTAGKV